MKVYLEMKKKGFIAYGEYNEKTNELTVFKDSAVSKTISHSLRFNNANAIENNRKGNLKGNIVIKDITFSSPSVAANFVTGTSTNGLLAWRNKEGISLKEIKNNKEK